MKSWPEPTVPSLPGTGLPAAALRHREPRRCGPPSPGPTARMYVCGITPYDATHMGHASTYVTFDLINRVWRDAGHDVHYVQNVTDIDDPLLERAVADRPGLAGDRRARDRAVPRGHGGAERAAAARLHRRRRVDPVRGRLRRGPAGAGRRLRGRLRPLLPGAPATRRFGSVANLDREQMLADLRRARRRPRPPGQGGPAGLPALAVGAPGRARLGHPARATAGPAGTSSAPRSRWTTSA